MCWSGRCRLRHTSCCTEVRLAPASAKAGMKASGSSIIRWQSSGSLVMGRSALTMGGPKVMLGTKWPSMTSMWTMVPPPRSAAATSSARWAKSEARMEKQRSIIRAVASCQLSVKCKSVEGSVSVWAMWFAAALGGGWTVGILFDDGDGALYIGATGVEGFGAAGFLGFVGGVAGGGVEWGLGKCFGVAEEYAGGSVEDAADGPCRLAGGIFPWEKDFAGALLLGAVVPAAEQRQVGRERGEVGGRGGLLFERGDEDGGAEFGAERAGERVLRRQPQVLRLRCDCRRIFAQDDRALRDRIAAFGVW